MLHHIITRAREHAVPAKELIILRTSVRQRAHEAFMH
ncbi:hypothetical protein BRADO2981 [Bradyrhizobium sp. ORS 278]|nr:hypothetical protein BRADO2981 [Bradyrhizobium sp. ORS 278]